MKTARPGWLPGTGAQTEALIKEARRRQRRRYLLTGVAVLVVLAGVAGVTVSRIGPGGRPPGRGRAASQDGPQSVPRYYMALVPGNLSDYVATGLDERDHAVIQDRITGQTLATVRPPKPYVTFVGVYGAADDRRFVLAAQSTEAGSLTSRVKFFSARFDPADNTVTLTPLALPGLPASNSFFAAALSPDGTRLAVASQNGPAQITVYSLPGGAAKTWSASASPGPFPFGSDVVNALSWSSTGILAFGGEYLLNTNTAGGSLLADSRHALCLEYAMPSANVADIHHAYLTPDGTKIIAPVLHPIPVGQTPSCSSGPAGPAPSTRPELEEFSATTGKAVRVIYASRSHAVEAANDVQWSSPSGSVLVLQSKAAGRSRTWFFGILSGSTFTPMPGSLSPPLVPQLAF